MYICSVQWLSPLLRVFNCVCVCVLNEVINVLLLLLLFCCSYKDKDKHLRERESFNQTAANFKVSSITHTLSTGVLCIL